MSYFLNAITRHYFHFSGRARRKEYWYFVLFSVLASWVCEFVDVIFNIYTTAGTERIGVVTTVYSLVLILPSLSVMVRRLHDVGRSGWFALAPYLPIAMIFIGAVVVIAGGFSPENWPFERILGGIQVFGVLVLAWIAVSIYVFVLLCTDSQPGPNRYGPNPKAADPTDAHFASAPSAPPPTSFSTSGLSTTRFCPSCGASAHDGEFCPSCDVPPHLSSV